MVDRGIGVGGLADSLENFTTSRYNLYAPFEFNQEVVSHRTATYTPRQHLDNYDSTMPIVFEIRPEVDHFTKLKTLKLHGNLRVENTTTNKAPEAPEVWSLCNGYPHALFSNVSVTVGDHEVVDSTSKPYPYKAILENLLVHEKAYSETVMPADGFIKDTNGDPDAINVKNTRGILTGENTGFIRRSEGLRNGEPKEFCISLHSDVITATRDLPPGIKMEVRLTRNSDSFVIWSPDSNRVGAPPAKDQPDERVHHKYKLILSDLRLTIEKVKVTDDIFNNYYNAVGRSAGRLAEIPFTRNMIRTYTTKENQLDWSFPNFVTNNQLPETVYVVFVPIDAYEGAPSENPFYFKEIKFQEASLIINARHEPSIPLTNVMDRYRMRDFYDHFLNNTGRDHFNSTAVNISMEEYFKKGYFILAWDRTPSGNNRFTRSTMDQGAITLNLKLQERQDVKYQVIMYCSYSDAIKIDGVNVTSSVTF